MAKPGPISQYDIIRKLARGGMGEVYLAKKIGIEGFSKEVVLKRIHASYAQNQHFIKLFLQEARIAAILDHPNIVQIHELGKTGEDYFIVMEYVRGLSLSRLMKAINQALPIQIAIQIAEGIAAGLQYAHDKKDVDGQPMNLVHRDISPPNILLSTSGSIKITDFGIAKFRSSITQTQVGVIKGKYSYISPEQACGEVASQQSDIYSLGLVLYEMATGVRAYPAGRSVDVLRAVAAGQVPPPEDHNPDFPNDLREILIRTLAINPKERYKECQELQEDLHSLLVKRKVVTTPAKLGRFVQKIVDQVEGADHKTPGQPVNIDLSSALENSSGSSPKEAFTDPPPDIIDISKRQIQEDIPNEKMSGEFDEDAETIMLDLEARRSVPTDADFDTDEPRVAGITVKESIEDVSSECSDSIAKPDQLRVGDMLVRGEGGKMYRVQMLSGFGAADGPGSLSEAAVEITAGRRSKSMVSFLAVAVGFVIGALVTWYMITDHNSTTSLSVAKLAATNQKHRPSSVVEKTKLLVHSKKANQNDEDADQKEGEKLVTPHQPKSLVALSVKTIPVTTVYIGKKRIGDTPLTTHVPPGELTLILQNSSLGIQTKRSLNPSGTHLSVKYNLREGTLGFQIPSRKIVLINGKKLGLSPLRPMAVWEGQYVITIINPSTKERTNHHVTIKPKRTTWVGSN